MNTQPQAASGRAAAPRPRRSRSRHAGSITSHATQGGQRWKFQIYVPKDPERPELGDTRLTRGGFKSLDDAQRALAEALRKKKSNARFQTKVPTIGEDGALAPSAINWTVKLRHGSHDHPYAGPQAGSSITVSYPAPEDLASTGNSYLIATAIATDSRGLTSRDDLQLLPKKVTLSFATSPSGGRVLVNDVARSTPSSLVSWPGYVLKLTAPNQSIGGVPYVFRSWSDGGAQTHSVTTPSMAKTYTATFARK